jgi:hypothetical protein
MGMHNFIPFPFAQFYFRRRQNRQNEKGLPELERFGAARLDIVNAEEESLQTAELMPLSCT